MSDIYRPAPGAHTPERRGPTAWRRLDLVLVLATLAIAAFGVLMVYSVTRVPLESTGASPDTYLKKQAIFVAIGAAVMLLLARIDYRRWRPLVPFIYGVAVILLLAVLKVGSSALGAQKWFQLGPLQLEPSEVAKLALILTLAAVASRGEGRLSGRRALLLVVLTGIPFVLVFKQPDLGTSLVLAAIVVAVICLAGMKLWQLGALTLIGVAGVFGLVQVGVLHQYQTARLTSFLHTPPTVNQKLLNAKTTTAANEYNVIQSKDAITHGGVSGTGLFKGTFTNLSEVPEQQTDFIFSAVGEQVGLVGCALLLLLFLIVMWRTWRSAAVARDAFGMLICVGVLAMLLFQLFENAGMTMGIMPVAGIPLPWMSYGGSALLVDFAAIGLVLSVRMHRAL
ncbi:MAG TPA: rod shape-determining protein RodA [Acidimicrobiales bacterium]|nr:rod shape-determining protein RodA [Acidimicrobiales bacterium]